MKARELLDHVLICTAALVLTAGIPIASNMTLFSGNNGSADGESGATVPLPDQPSGDYLVLINTAKHPDTLNDWEAFFTDSDFAVIFEDIRCMTAVGDVNAQQLAERYQLELPENQMILRQEDSTLLASKAEAGYIDVAVLSKEMADILHLKEDLPGITVIHVTGGDSE